MNADFMLGIIGLCGGLLCAIANIFGICAVVGSCSTMFIHATLCYLPIISKTMIKDKVSQDTIGKTVNALYQTIIVPFLAFWLLLVVGLSGIVIYAVLAGVLLLSWGFVLLTPLGLVIIGIIFRLINRKVFADLPGICMPSIGIAMIGLMAALNSLM